MKNINKPNSDYTQYLKEEYENPGSVFPIPESFTMARTITGYKLIIDFDGALEKTDADCDQPLPRRVVINLENDLIMEEILLLFERNYKDFSNKLYLCGKECESKYCHSCAINKQFNIVQKPTTKHEYDAGECGRCENRDCINCQHFNKISGGI